MKVVGILGELPGDPYSLRLMHSAATQLVNEGCHAICFMGGFPRAPLYRTTTSETPRLPPLLDGWVMLSSTMRVSAGDLRALVHGAKPCVSVGLELPETPSLTASDEAGIFQAVTHLARR